MTRTIIRRRRTTAEAEPPTITGVRPSVLPVDCTEAVPVEFDLTHVMPNFVVVSVAQEEFLPQSPTTSVQGEVIS